MTGTVVIRFCTPVNEASIGALMETMDQKRTAGAGEFPIKAGG